jgi:hypothetical protein
MPKNYHYKLLCEKVPLTVYKIYMGQDLYQNSIKIWIRIWTKTVRIRNTGIDNIFQVYLDFEES